MQSLLAELDGKPNGFTPCSALEEFDDLARAFSLRLLRDPKRQHREATSRFSWEYPRSSVAS